LSFECPRISGQEALKSEKPAVGGEPRQASLKSLPGEQSPLLLAALYLSRYENRPPGCQGLAVKVWGSFRYRRLSILKELSSGVSRRGGVSERPGAGLQPLGDGAGLLAGSEARGPFLLAASLLLSGGLAWPLAPEPPPEELQLPPAALQHLLGRLGRLG
jgi:hypothetical protein